jgi:hypothetical protein
MFDEEKKSNYLIVSNYLSKNLTPIVLVLGVVATYLIAKKVLK